MEAIDRVGDKYRSFKDKLKDHWYENKNKYKLAVSAAAIGGSFAAGMKASNVMHKKGKLALVWKKERDLDNKAYANVRARHKND